MYVYIEVRVIYNTLLTIYIYGMTQQLLIISIKTIMND